MDSFTRSLIEARLGVVRVARVDHQGLGSSEVLLIDGGDELVGELRRSIDANVQRHRDQRNGKEREAERESWTQ